MDVLALILASIAAISVATCAVFVVRRHSRFRGTTLIPAWWWTLATLCWWFAGSIAWLIPDHFDGRTRDAIWYMAAVFSVCPGIAVLGARRPVAGIWSAFVVLPLILVLSMPLISTWQSTEGRFDWVSLETPMFLGFGLVIVMGCGNYIGTRFSAAVFSVGLAILLVVATFFWGLKMGVRDEVPRFWAVLFLISGIITAVWRTRTSIRNQSKVVPSEPVERLWHEFVNTFGIAWAKRVGERINWAAEEEKLSARVDFSGIVWTETSLSEEQRSHSRSRIDSVLRRLLKRFVDPGWIESRVREGRLPTAQDDADEQTVLPN